MLRRVVVSESGYSNVYILLMSMEPSRAGRGCADRLVAGACSIVTRNALKVL